jgi:DNA modification methylase
MNANYILHHGDNLTYLKTIPDNTYDSIVTDPPYFINFLGKEWDTDKSDFTPLFKECLRVLKPGGYLLAFSAARTYHKLATQVEDAGFEIRDQLMWLYSSGFPKSQDIGKAIQKRIWGKPDKPRFDPSIMIHIDNDQWKHPDTGVIYRKLPDINGDRLLKSMEGYGCVFEEVVARETTSKELAQYGGISNQNNREHGIDYTCDKERTVVITQPVCTSPLAKEWEGWKGALKPAHEPIVMARKPFKSSTIDNVLKNGLGAMNIDASRVPWADKKDAVNEQAFKPMENCVGGGLYDGVITDRTKKKKSDKEQRQERDAPILMPHDGGRYPSNVIGEVAEGYQKYFMCPKVSRKERHCGFTELPPPTTTGILGDNGDWKNCDSNTEGGKANRSSIGNNHPTVKPVALMDYLIKLVTPPSTSTLQRKVLDPFMGSGSTGMAATKLGHHFTGCDLDEKYVAISKTRIDAWNAPDPDAVEATFGDLFGGVKNE